MFSDGMVVIGTGDDDLREGSQVFVRIYLCDRPPVVFEVARGARFPDGTDTARIPWRLSSRHRPPVRTEDVERIEVAFVPNRRSLMYDDKWLFRNLTVEVNDDMATGATRLYRNDAVNHKFENAGTWSSGILPTYSCLGSTIIRVSDDSDRRVPGAEVFISSRLVGVTDSSGQLQVPASSVIPTAVGGGRSMFVDIVVRKRIHEQGYYRSNHDVESSQNWNYRVYLTNVSIWSNGVASPDWGGFGSVMDITVHRDNTLIGLNLLVSVEWDLALTDLATLEGTINDFSAFLYNATDGQFFVEVAQITDRRELWDDSDIRISADGNYVANVPHARGAFHGWNVPSSEMNMSRDNGSKTYAQQFGHYGLSLGDEYRNGAVCTRNVSGRSVFRSGRSRASCMMWDPYNANKICSRHTGNPHVRGTNQGNEACWDTIVHRYDFDSHWNIRTPTSRGTIPGTIRYSGGSGGSSLRAAFMMPKIYRRLRPDGHRLIGELTLMVRDRGGAPVTGVVVKTREPGGSWLVQGTTDEFGNRTMAGIHVGDRLRLEGGSDAVYEQDIPSGTSGALTVNVPF